MQKKVRRLSIKLTEENYDRIHENARKARKNLTDYITDLALGKQFIIIISLSEVLRELRAVGANLNRIALLANMDRIEVVNLSSTRSGLAEVSTKLNEILERRRWST